MGPQEAGLFVFGVWVIAVFGLETGCGGVAGRIGIGWLEHRVRCGDASRSTTALGVAWYG